VEPPRRRVETRGRHSETRRVHSKEVDPARRKSSPTQLAAGDGFFTREWTGVSVKARPAEKGKRGQVI